MKFWLILLIILIVRFLYYLFKFFYGFILEDVWKDRSTRLSYVNQIQNYLKIAGIDKNVISIINKVAYDFVRFDNQFVKSTINSFVIARGYYRDMAFNSFNIVYLIKLILFIPKNIIAYLGLDTETIFSKIFQFIFWIGSVLLGVYQPEINQFIRTILEPIIELFSSIFVK